MMLDIVRSDCTGGGMHGMYIGMQIPDDICNIQSPPPIHNTLGTDTKRCIYQCKQINNQDINTKSDANFVWLAYINEIVVHFGRKSIKFT